MVRSSPHSPSSHLSWPHHTTPHSPIHHTPSQSQQHIKHHPNLTSHSSHHPPPHYLYHLCTTTPQPRHHPSHSSHHCTPPQHHQTPSSPLPHHHHRHLLSRCTTRGTAQRQHPFTGVSGTCNRSARSQCTLLASVWPPPPV